MSGISPISTGTATRLQTNTPTTRAAATAETTGYAARIGQLGPTLGTVVATGELLSDAASATYTIATQKLNQLGNAANTAVNSAEEALDTLGNAASEAWTEASQAVEDAAETTVDTVSSAAHALASAFEQGTDKIGRWIDEAV